MAATPGSIVGVSKTGRYFDVNMDSVRQETESAGFIKEVPTYITSGIVRNRAGKQEVIHLRQLPSNCVHRKRRVDGQNRSLSCLSHPRTPLSGVAYKVTKEESGKLIYSCIRRCSNNVPRSMQYEDLD